MILLYIMASSTPYVKVVKNPEIGKDYFMEMKYETEDFRIIQGRCMGTYLGTKQMILSAGWDEPHETNMMIFWVKEAYQNGHVACRNIDILGSPIETIPGIVFVDMVNVALYEEGTTGKPSDAEILHNDPFILVRLYHRSNHLHRQHTKNIKNAKKITLRNKTLLPELSKSVVSFLSPSGVS